MKHLHLLLVFTLLATSTYADEGDDDDDDVYILEPTPGGLSGQGITTRYWDCCKPSCGWVENTGDPTQAVKTCGVDGYTDMGYHNQSGCVDDVNAGSYMCTDQQPFAVNETFAVGFGAASFRGGADVDYCCRCMLIEFQSAPLVGKKMVVQVTNTGGDLGQNQFDIALPGAGVGIFPQGCVNQWNAPPQGWGDQYGGVHSQEECAELPEDLQPGCEFRFTWFEAADNPGVMFTQVKCPQQLVDITGCRID